ncbi:MAG TPA: CDP-diacylglycerol--glycerol-3-phosphate 3-phosphatidyltransferase, partial [Treponema sp.]|nr:CDP-diacylglycerol--glycerol-3-phosphate 3-phosphatidyltransferase [Treponema sp.]
MKISNTFTFTRVLLAPVFFIIYYLPLWIGSPVASPLQIASVCVLLPLLA